MRRFEIDDETEEEVLEEDESEDEINPYIRDPEMAVKLVSKMIGYGIPETERRKREIRTEIEDIFDLISDVPIPNIMHHYRSFMSVYNRLSELRKTSYIKDHVIIGVGGRFSSGKSTFINGIVGLGDVLPEAISPTTAIATYVVKSETDFCKCNNMSGSMSGLVEEELQALSHGFFDKYKVGFSSFVESIVIGSSQYALDDRLILLDTPGYNKFDQVTKASITDRENAKRQLRMSDHLIWMIDIDNGVITDEDIRFIDQLKINTPILIVFNKCDKKIDSDIKEILSVSSDTVRDLELNCYAIVAYSSEEHKEYDGEYFEYKKKFNGHIIDDYFDFVLEEGDRGFDILTEFDRVASDFMKEIEIYYKEIEISIRELRKEIINNETTMGVKSLAEVWGLYSKQYSKRKEKEREIKELLEKIKKNINQYLKGDPSEKGRTLS